MTIQVEGTSKDPYRTIVAILTVTPEEVQRQTVLVEEGSQDAETAVNKALAIAAAVVPAAHGALNGLAREEYPEKPRPK